VLVTSGGVSVGPHDLVRGTLAELGAEEVFWRVAMRPGKPISFATRGATLVFGLPGNPVSSFVGALLFVVPALRALQGALDPAPRFEVGTLAAPARRNPHRDDFQRARTEASEAGTVLMPIEGQDSHMIVRAAAADAIVHVPRGEGELPAGSVVRYLPLGAV
jgi:molybdopterin molybdotransferase